MTIIVFSCPILFVLSHNVHVHCLDSIESRASHSRHMPGSMMSRWRGHTIPVVVAARPQTAGINVSCLICYAAAHVVRVFDDDRAHPGTRNMWGFRSLLHRRAKMEELAPGSGGTGARRKSGDTWRLGSLPRRE
jgi:hypothetical protein